MNIQEEHNKRVTLHMADRLEQKIDKLTVMMGKLVMTDNGQTDSLNCKFIKAIEKEGKCNAITNREVFKTGLDQTVAGAILLEEGQGMDRNIEVCQGMTQIIGEITETI